MVPNLNMEDGAMKCEVCDEEFDTENELLQHKAKMHAGGQSEMPGREAPGTEMPEDLEEPDFKQAANE